MFLLIAPGTPLKGRKGTPGRPSLLIFKILSNVYCIFLFKLPRQSIRNKRNCWSAATRRRFSSAFCGRATSHKLRPGTSAPLSGPNLQHTSGSKSRALNTCGSTQSRHAYSHTCIAAARLPHPHSLASLMFLCLPPSLLEAEQTA
jgi:hypothetical protein